MIDFDKHIIERADAKYAHMRRCAEMDNSMMFATTRAPNGERI
jgi:hypothetical protein